MTRTPAENKAVWAKIKTNRPKPTQERLAYLEDQLHTLLEGKPIKEVNMLAAKFVEDLDNNNQVMTKLRVDLNKLDKKITDFIEVMIDFIKK